MGGDTLSWGEAHTSKKLDSLEEGAKGYKVN